jgi:DNA-binding XRE family transcriptional regulator
MVYSDFQHLGLGSVFMPGKYLLTFIACFIVGCGCISLHADATPTKDIVRLQYTEGKSSPIILKDWQVPVLQGASSCGIYPWSLYEIDGIAPMLVARRKELGWTQQDLAKLAGLTLQQVHTNEATKYASVTLKEISRIARVLDRGRTIRYHVHHGKK